MYWNKYLLTNVYWQIGLVRLGRVPGNLWIYQKIEKHLLVFKIRRIAASWIFQLILVPTISGVQVCASSADEIASIVKTDLPVNNSTKAVTCQGFKCHMVVSNSSKKYHWGLIEFRHYQKIDLGDHWRQLQANITVKCGLYNLHSQQAVALDSKRGEDAGPDSNPVNSLRAKAKDLFQEVTYSKMG